jgi:O-antigen ligase
VTLLAAPWRRIGELRAHRRALLPFGLYCLGLTVSIAASDAPRLSAGAIRELFSLTVFPLALWLLPGERTMRRLVDGLGALGAFSAAIGLVQALGGWGDIERRIRGPFSHYMTFSGVLIVCSLLLVGRLATGDGWRSRWRWAAVLLMQWAILASLTRSAWLALGAALAVLAVAKLVRRPRLLAWSVPVLAAVFLLAPIPWVGRGLSIGDPGDSSNYDRLCMARAGLRMVAERPLFGIGPELAEHRYAIYREQSAPRWQVPHLHSNFVQLAAERGAVSLAAWIWWLGAGLVEAARGVRRRGSGADLHFGSLLALIGFVVAGAFEYNWGDTEVQRVVLATLAIPHVLRRSNV